MHTCSVLAEKMPAQFHEWDRASESANLNNCEMKWTFELVEKHEDCYATNYLNTEARTNLMRTEHLLEVKTLSYYKEPEKIKQSSSL